jgi:molybdopterin-guanine dinucleotide biosynthesis protein A
MNCYILTGGLSRRMGTSKRSLRIGNETFLERTLRVARSAFDEVIVVDRSADARDQVRTIVEPSHDETSPLFGIAAALRDATDRAWILAVDYPLLTPEVLRFLRQRFELSTSLMLVPRWKEKLQMLCAGYAPSLLEAVERKLARGDLQIRGLVDEFGAEIVDESVLRARFEGEPLVNVNTPEDYREAQTHAPGR